MAQPSEPYTQGSTTNSVRTKGRIGVVNPVKQIPSWMSAGTTAAHYATDADLAAARTLEQSRAMAANNANGGQYGLNLGLSGGGGGYATPSSVQTQSAPIQSTGGGYAGTPAPMASSTGGGGSVSPSGTAAGGYAGKYVTGLEPTVAYDNPEILASDVLKSMGINDPTLASMLASDANFASLAAFLTAGNGSRQGSGNTSDSAVVNYMANYFKNQASVGGAGPNTGALVDSILNSASDPNGQIAQYLGINSSQPNANQLSTVTNLVNNTLQNSLNDQNPYTQRATKNMLAQQATNYAAAQAHGQKVPDYATYLKGTQLGNWF